MKSLIFGKNYREVTEWLKVLAWKACIPQKGIKGSNPFLSTTNNNRKLKLNSFFKYRTMKKLFITGIIACATLFASPVFAGETDTTKNTTEEVVDSNATATAEDTTAADSNATAEAPVEAPVVAEAVEEAAPKVIEEKEVTQQNPWKQSYKDHWHFLFTYLQWFY